MMKNVARDKKREKQNHLFLIKKKNKEFKERSYTCGDGQNYPPINGYRSWVTATVGFIIRFCLLWYIFEILHDKKFFKKIKVYFWYSVTFTCYSYQSGSIT